LRSQPACEFDSRKLVDAKQIADLQLLRHHLAESLWWMHGQPPLYNLYIGVVVKCSPDTFERPSSSRSS
jgi:hypothetical protein